MKNSQITILKTIVILLFFVNHFHAYSQPASSCSALHEKYWHYRERLVQNFMLGVGPAMGFSLPAENRFELGTEPTLRWGDATIYLGYYIGVLATEYKLLVNEGKSTDNTIKELFYALHAINRLDYTAEGFYNGTNELNGFFIRDDIDIFSEQPVSIQNHVNHNSSIHNEISKFLSDFRSPEGEPTDNEESLDQVFQLLWGLALVKQFVPSTVFYLNSFGVPESFQWESPVEYSLQEEAIKITERILTKIHSFSNYNWENTHWIIRNPVTGDHVARGWDCTPEAYGLDWAADFITGQRFPHHPFDYAWINAHDVWMANEPCATTPCYNLKDIDKIATLAAIGNAFTIDQDNETNAEIISGMEFYGDYVHVPLIHLALRGGSYINFFSKNDYLNLLNSAPDVTDFTAIIPGLIAEGPYNFGTASGIPFIYEWSSRSRTLHPENRLAGEESNHGEFNGLDYMILHNLFFLNNCCPDQLFFENQNYSTYRPPFKATNSIRAGFDVGGPDNNGNVTIHTGGNINYIAGNTVSLEDGFYAEPGSEFFASIGVCCPQDFSNSIDVVNFPTDFSPDGDNWDDILCVTVYGATYYHVRVYDPILGKIYDHGDNIRTNPVCLWDGSGSNEWNFTEDYTVEVVFYGCSDTKTENHIVHADGTKHTYRPTNDSTIIDSTNYQNQSLLQNQTIENLSEAFNFSYLNNINVYPVPANKTISIDFNSNLGEKIEILNVLGQTVLEMKTGHGNLVVLNISNLQQGVYFVKVYYKNSHTFIKKILKN